MIWFTSDYHLSHKNIIEYCNRPFENVQVMDRTIVKNLERKLEPGDILYYLGDLTFDINAALHFFKNFKDIQIHFIIGNHDSTKILEIAYKFCVTVSNLKVIKLNMQNIILCHYPISIDNDKHNSWCLYGHSHGKRAQKEREYDVSVDNNDFLPLSYHELTEIMRKSKFNVV